MDDLLQALLKFDEITIAALLNEAFSIYSTEKGCCQYRSSSDRQIINVKNNNEISMVQFQYALSFYKRV